MQHPRHGDAYLTVGLTAVHPGYLAPGAAGVDLRHCRPAGTATARRFGSEVIDGCGFSASTAVVRPLLHGRWESEVSYNKLVFGGLALGCMAAAAGGGFLAARQPSSAPVAVSAPAPDASAESANASTQPVTESEGVITADPAAVSAAPASGVPDSAEAPPRPDSAPRPARTVPAPERRAEPGAPPARNARNEARTESREPAAPSTAPPPSTGGMWEARPAIEPERVPVAVSEPEAPAPPAAPELMEVVIPSDAVLGLQIERTITSETARLEDRVEARLTRDVRVGDRVAIPAGSMVQGSVMEVERGGKIKERARLGIRFHTVVLADGSRLNVRTDSVVREGSAVARESAAKIGGAAVGGAILGAILGGGKGAIIGGATGAAGGTAATMAGERNPAVLPAGTTVSVRVQQPVTVTVEK